MERFEVPFIGITECLTSHGKWRPERTAVVCGQRRLNYGQFNRLVNQVANGLIELGLRKGDMVALLSINSVETMALIFGILKAGGVVVPLSNMVSGEVLTMMINDSGSRVLFVESSALLDLISPFKKRMTGVRPDGFISLGFESPGWQSFSEWIAKQPDTEPDLVFQPDDVFSIIYSSGTTGTPKGIVHNHGVRLNWTMWLAITLKLHPMAATMISTPLYTMGTWTTLLPTVTMGGTVVLMPKFDPKHFLELVHREKCTHALMVPTQFIVILDLPDFDQYDVSSMEVMASGAAPLRENTKKEIVERFGCNIIEIYGNSEGIGTFSSLDEAGINIGSVGKPPAGFDIRILDDEGRELPRGEIGEIAGYAVGMMQEYFMLPDQTSEAVWRDERGRTYLKTGDIGRLDEEGFLYILDRKKDMIVSGGINVFASDIEAIVIDHPAVKDIAVIAVPHEKWGETPLALVIPEKDATASEDDVKAWANQRLAKYQRLAGVEFRDAFPRNALGKVLKRELREPFWQDC